MVSLIIPTYNEQANVVPLLERVGAIRPTLGEPLEVLVVDGASTDATVALAGHTLERLGLGRVVTLKGRCDLAMAVIEGVQQAGGDVLGVMDADLSHPPELLPALVQAVREGSEIAIASRYVASGGVRDWPWSRRWLSRLGNALARPLVPVHDATSGYFVCQTKLFHRSDIRPSGFKILLELLVQARPTSIREIPYLFVDRASGTSKLTFPTLWCYLKQLVRLYGTRWFLRYPAPLSCQAVSGRATHSQASKLNSDG
jgi:dolichol-phosphate mannosyltransferase